MKIAHLVLLAVLVGVSAFATPDDYAIQLNRPTKPGDRYRLDARGTDRKRQRITIGGQTQNEEKEISVRLTAAATVLATDAKARATRIEYVVESLQRTAGGKTDEPLAAGHKVVAEANETGKTVFTVDADPALEGISEALAVVITASPAGSPTDDEIFGTADRKKVGDTWEINALTAAADLAQAGVKVAPQDLKGTVSVGAVRTIGASRALEITGHMKSDRMTMDDLPEWLSVEKISLQADFTLYSPLDSRSPEPLPGKIHVRIDAVMRGERPETGAPVLVELGMETSQERTYVSLSPEQPARTSEGRQAGTSGARRIVRRPRPPGRPTTASLVTTE